jgi:LPXTG-motif cell wall-anchored protein
MAYLLRLPWLPRAIVAVAATVLVSVVGAAGAQGTVYIVTGPLTAPTTAAAGQPFQVEGAGFAPGGSVSITIESRPLLLATVGADARGAFATTVTVPTTFPPGQHTLRATGPDPAGLTRVLSAPITVAAPITVTEPAPVPPEPAPVLPVTGSTVLPLAFLAVAALVAGTAMLLVRRRRAETT